MIAARDQEERTKQALHALKGQLSDVPVTLQLVWVNRLAKRVDEQVQAAREQVKAKGKDILAVFWCDLSDPPHLYLFAPKPNRFLERSLKGSAAGEQLESIAVIVRTSVSALLAGKPIGKKPPPPPRPRPRARPRSRSKPPPVVKVKTRKPRRQWLRLETAYALDGYSTDVGVTHGFYAAVSVHLHRNWSVVADFRVLPGISTSISAPDVSARLNRYPIGIGARFRWPLGRFEVGGTLRVVMEYVKPRTSGTEVVLESDEGAFLFSAVPMFYGSVRVVWRVRAFLAAGVRVAFNRRRYVVESAADTKVLAEPWPAQPLVLAGVCVDVF
jgi:hypothetical protein